MSIKCPDPILKEGLVKAHLKKYWAAGAVEGQRNCLIDTTKFVDLLETSGYPPYEWVLDSVIMFCDRRRSIVLEEHRDILARYKSRNIPKERNIPENRRESSYKTFAKFRKITRLNSRMEADPRIMKIEEGAWNNAFHVCVWGWGASGRANPIRGLGNWCGRGGGGYYRSKNTNSGKNIFAVFQSGSFRRLKTCAPP